MNDKKQTLTFELADGSTVTMEAVAVDFQFEVKRPAIDFTTIGAGDSRFGSRVFMPMPQQTEVTVRYLVTGNIDQRVAEELQSSGVGGRKLRL